MQLFGENGICIRKFKFIQGLKMPGLILSFIAFYRCFTDVCSSNHKIKNVINCSDSDLDPEDINEIEAVV